MTPIHNPAPYKRLSRYGLIAVLTALFACTAGCHSSEDASNGVSVPHPTAQSGAQSAAEVENNPNIPPQAKANITAEIQGKAPAPTGAAHP